MMTDKLSFDTGEVYVPNGFATTPTLGELATALAPARPPSAP